MGASTQLGPGPHGPWVVQCGPDCTAAAKAGEFSKRGGFLAVSRSTPPRGSECSELQGKSSHLALSWVAEGSLRVRAPSAWAEKGFPFIPALQGHTSEAAWTQRDLPLSSVGFIPSWEPGQAGE